MPWKFLYLSFKSPLDKASTSILYGIDRGNDTNIWSQISHEYNILRFVLHKIWSNTHVSYLALYSIEQNKEQIVTIQIIKWEIDKIFSPSNMSVSCFLCKFLFKFYVQLYLFKNVV